MNKARIIYLQRLSENIVQGLKAIRYIKPLKVSRPSKYTRIFESEMALDGEWSIALEEIAADLDEILMLRKVNSHRLTKLIERKRGYVDRPVFPNQS